MKTIEVESLTKVRNKQTVIDDVSFTVDSGEFMAILGSNNSGKTTLLKLLVGLITPTSGSIRINGFDIADSMNSLKDVGCVIDTPGCYDKYSPREMLRYNGKLRGMSGSSLEDEIRNVLEYTDLWEYRDALVSKFSKGLMKKFALAGALLSNPSILILDEPGSGIDNDGLCGLQKILGDIKRDNRTVLMSTHSYDRVSNYCSSVVMLEGGRCIAQGQLKDIFGDMGIFKPLVEFKTQTKLSSEIIEEINALEGVHNVTKENENSFRVRFLDEPRELMELYRILSDNGIELTAMNDIQTSINDLFAYVKGGRK